MKCPMCGTTADKAYRPFCSRRCADRDLANWFNGSYATPSHDPEDAEAAMEAVESDRIGTLKPH